MEQLTAIGMTQENQPHTTNYDKTSFTTTTSRLSIIDGFDK